MEAQKLGLEEGTSMNPFELHLISLGLGAENHFLMHEFSYKRRSHNYD
jgi:hypothetical protein